MPQSEYGFLKFFREHWANFIVGLAMVAGVIFSFGMILTSDGKNPREAALEGILLSAASIGASYLITKASADQENDKRLRALGVQVAGTIMVLRGQIERLSDWIAVKRDSPEPSVVNSEVSDLALEHIQETLQDFVGQTDSALKGIGGVMGDAIAQYEQMIVDINSIRLHALHQTTELQEQMQTASSGELSRLRADIQKISLETEKQIAELAKKSALPIPEITPKRSVAVEISVKRPLKEKCPHCARDNSFEMLDRAGETRVVECLYCGRLFNAHIGFGHKVVVRGVKATPPEVGGTEFQRAVRKFLVDTQAWVDPVIIKPLVKAALETDTQMKRDERLRSPRSLQCALLERSEHFGFARGPIRRFCKLVFQGRGFEFHDGVRSGLQTPYTNDLTETGLFLAFLRASLHRARQVEGATQDHESEVASLLLADDGALASNLLAQIAAKRDSNAALNRS